MNYTWYEMGWIVLIYSFLGWCAEVAFAAVRHGRFVNRGFLNGPVCPIYGYGVLCVLLILEPVKSNLVLLFFGSMFFTSAIEFLVGFIMEQLFHDKWWDYSNNPFNIKGYVCLEFSIIWGIACVLVVDVIHPMIYALIKKLSTPVGILVMAALLALLVFDAILTLAEMLKLNKRFKAITELECAIHSVSDAMGEKLIYEPMERGKERRVAFDEKHPEFAEKKREAVEDVMAKRSEINVAVKEREDARREELAAKKAELEAKLAELRKTNFIHARIAAAYPHLSEGEHNGENFRKLRDYIEQKRAEKKGKK